MKAILLNDTSSWHAGSAASVRMIKEAISRAGWDLVMSTDVNTPPINNFNDADIVICNGEGTMHHGNGAGLMMSLTRAKARGIKAMLINSVWQAQPAVYVETLRKLDRVIVRDRASYQALLDLGIYVELRPDVSSNVIADMPHGQRRGICLGGPGVLRGWSKVWGSLAADSRASIDHSCSFEQTIAAVSIASLYVTAQHHGIIAAALAQTPFVACLSNSWKMEGMLEYFGIRVCRDIEQVRAAIDNPQLEKCQEFSDWIRSFKPLELSTQ